MKTKIIYIFILLFAFTSTYGQEKQEKREEYCAEVAFALGSSVLDTEIGTNKATLASFTQNINELLQDSTVTIEKIIITSKASPEGGVAYNKTLATKRSNSITAYINDHLNIPKSLLVINNIGTEWKMLQEMVEASNIEKKSEILYVINNVPEETWTKEKSTDKYLTLTDSRLKHLMDLHYGIPYRRMEKEFFPAMRSSSVVTIYYSRKIEPKTSNQDVITIKENLEEPTDSVKVETPQISTCEPPIKKEPLFALKTNLLFDLATVLNAEIEVPIGKRWSIAAEGLFPWWVTKDNGNALQVNAAFLEGKYWLGNREKRPVMTGWYVGLNVGGGLYDLQYKDNGYQGEFFLATGLSAGFAHTINKSGTLRMEYAIGAGILQTEYRYYEGRKNNKYLVWQHDGKYTWIGSTKARISLVWVINKKSKGGKR